MKYYNIILKLVMISPIFVTTMYAGDLPADSGSAAIMQLTASTPIVPSEIIEALKADANGRVIIKSWSSKDPLPDPELNTVKQGIYRGIEAIVLGQSPYPVLEDVYDQDYRDRVITCKSLHPYFLLIIDMIQDLERRKATLIGDSLASERARLDTERTRLTKVKDSAISLTIHFLAYLGAVKKQLDQIELAKRERDAADLTVSEQKLKIHTINALSALHAIFDFNSDSGYIASYQRKAQRTATLGQRQINGEFDFKTGKGVGDNLHDKAFSKFLQGLIDPENVLIIGAIERGAITLVQKEATGV